MTTPGVSCSYIFYDKIGELLAILVIRRLNVWTLREWSRIRFKRHSSLLFPSVGDIGKQR
jgi:hypothetical protein